MANPQLSYEEAMGILGLGQDPMGDRKTLLNARQVLKALFNQKDQYAVGSTQRNCVELAYKAVLLCTVCRVQWRSWEDDERGQALSLIEQAINTPLCPPDARAALTASRNALYQDNSVLGTRPNNKDRDVSVLNNFGGLRLMVEDVKRALTRDFLLGNVYPGRNPAVHILASMRFVLASRVGWNTKCEILCMAMVCFPGYWFQTDSQALRAVENGNEMYLR